MIDDVNAMTQEERSEAWLAWLDSRPESVRKVAVAFTPDKAYRIRSTGQNVTVIAYAEDGTMRVRLDDNNPLVPYNEVFGLKPEDLEAV